VRASSGGTTFASCAGNTTFWMMMIARGDGDRDERPGIPPSAAAADGRDHDERARHRHRPAHDALMT
jgi:hypothetical protein